MGIMSLGLSTFECKKCHTYQIHVNTCYGRTGAGDRKFSYSAMRPSGEETVLEVAGGEQFLVTRPRLAQLLSTKLLELLR